VAKTRRGEKKKTNLGVESRKLKVYKVEKQLSLSGKKRSCEKRKTSLGADDGETIVIPLHVVAMC
jgi:hypothetical protein